MISLITACNENKISSIISEPVDDSNLPLDNMDGVVSFVVSPTNDYLDIVLTADSYHMWNCQSLNDVDSTHLPKMTNAILDRFNDEFDFIIFILNNETPYCQRPFGEFAFVKNDTKGIGLSLFDNGLTFGSGPNGKLQGVFALYGSMNHSGVLKALHLDATLHEMFHRWGNWIVPQAYNSHWDAVEGVLTGHSTFAAIELYLMGLISSPDGQDANAWDLDSESVYRSWEDSARFELRAPGIKNAQTTFKSLVVLLSSENEPVLPELKVKLSNNITNFTRQDGLHKTYNQGQVISQNFWHATHNKASISMKGLNSIRKAAYGHEVERE